MSRPKLHADEAAIDLPLVHQLVEAQFPQWASLPIEPVESAGTDNAIFRLGAEMAIRLPRVQRAVRPLQKEQQWLARLAPALPLKVPVPVASGLPAGGYRWPWVVYTWLEGTAMDIRPAADASQTALRLGRFVNALHALDPTGGPPPGEHNFWRGVPLAERDADTREAIELLSGSIDAKAVTEAWEAALATPAWDRPPVWIHGDLLPGNLLVLDGTLDAVIDFGGLGVGDPASDLMAAWTLFSGPSPARSEMRSASIMRPGHAAAAGRSRGR